jgi:hypothetical protein
MFVEIIAGSWKMVLYKKLGDDSLFLLQKYVLFAIKKSGFLLFHNSILHSLADSVAKVYLMIGLSHFTISSSLLCHS